MSGRRTDTRERIQQVAMDLFLRQGYEKTSLREVAERLGVTKAALYYHFKTKEDIVVALFEGAVRDIDDLLEWGHGQSATVEGRREILVRLSTIVSERLRPMLQFTQENQPALRELEHASKGLPEKVHAVFTLLDTPDAPLMEKLRRRLAVFAIYLGNNVSFFGLPDASPEETAAAALEVACELVSPLQR